MTDFRVCLVSVPSQEVGLTLARAVLEARLAACVNVIPGCRSLFWWEGAIQDDTELLLIVKTSEPKLAELTRFVVARHPYDCPEVLALPVTGGSAAYLDWMTLALNP
jgi:periplasmic divalent cation tolerance protein